MNMERVPAAVDGLLREQAILSSIQYHDPHGPWALCIFRRDDGTTFTATGSFGQSILYEEFILYGKWSPDIPGGDFDTASFSSMPPKALETLPRYLSSLTQNRVQISATSKAVQHFGENLIDILERAPGRLVEAGVSTNDAEVLGNTWATERSNQLALAQIDLEGIPPQRLGTLQRRLGYMTDLNTALRQDPYLLYVHFDDMLFSTAQSLAKRFRVTNDTVSAVKGAIVAILRREAWLGHSYIEGHPLMEGVGKLLNLDRTVLFDLIKEAVTQLCLAKVALAEDKKLQLYNLYEIEKSLVEKAASWTKLNADDLEDLVPSEAIAQKLLRPLKLGAPAARTLGAGLCCLMAERLALVQCETLHDQLTIVQGIQLFLNAYGSDVVVSAASREMVAELSKTLGDDAQVVGYAELIGLDPVSGVPLQHQQSPIQADVVVFVGTDALGVEEIHFLLEAMPKTGRIFMLGAPKDLPSQTVGQPFDELAKVPEIRTFIASFWLSARTEHRIAAKDVWSGSIKPDDSFDPSRPVSWLNTPRDDIAAVVNFLLRELSDSCEISPLHDIKAVIARQHADVPGSDAIAWLTRSIAAEFIGGAEPIEFQGKPLYKGMPALVRQALSLEHPAFSIFDATELTSEKMVATPRDGSPVVLNLKRNLNLFHGAVLTPKFIRGRVYEFVILIVLKEHMGLLNAELLSTLLNSTKRSLILVGELDDVAASFPGNEPTRVRSLLPKWMARNGDQICPT
ncbi:exodeoxyribonuclease [Pseudomonas violetae]|uniref:Exodeoxyribonuclease n=1 Tax=Pseudomonas violetae TaxID=2915813 RepID=A0ABT0ET34_9PSED|nr:exodeoxyribonuclease [Pseudomonas violetae]MCK1788898.1 exodeoxyribonuclease [Pseudomonas violetae]